MTIDSEVPFGHAVYVRLYLNGIHLDKATTHDEMETNYLAWETVRKQINPYFVDGTGFEGYLIGRCALPEAALDSILAINQHILDAIARFYRFEYSLRSRLIKTLTRENSDPEAIHIWSAYLGAELGRLRAQILGDYKAEMFRLRTYKMISTLPPMIYHETNDDVTQTYAVASVGNVTLAKLNITPQMLKPSQQDAWLVAENIGEFGHPLVRKFLDHA